MKIRAEYLKERKRQNIFFLSLSLSSFFSARNIEKKRREEGSL